MNAVTRLLVAPLLTALVAGCAGPAPRPAPEPQDGPPLRSVEPDSVPQPVPRSESRARYGNPPSYQVFGQTYHVLDSSRDYVERGIASWYGTKFQGRRTSSGEPYDMFRYTAAHRTLPLPTYAQVTNMENGRSVIVRINDRGPFKDSRIIDLSYIAAQKLGFADKGMARVEVRAIDPQSGGQPERVDVPRQDGTIWLQAGAFAEPRNAEALRARLSGAGLGPVDVTPVMLGAGTLYRVRIGPLANGERASEMVRRVQDLGLEPPRLILD